MSKESLNPTVTIPEKLFFKIGEVCGLAGVQAHVLRYWESEFSMLAPQKNRAGQRTYRKKDVEIALRIKDLLYEEKYTIAGARKKLTGELRSGNKLKVISQEVREPTNIEPKEDSGRVVSQFDSTAKKSTTKMVESKLLTDNLFDGLHDLNMQTPPGLSNEQLALMKKVKKELEEILKLFGRR